MRRQPQLLARDELNRRVLFAVELVDPITHALVSRGVTVRAAGLDGRPIVSHSGRFVWLEEGDVWPGAISVEPERSSYDVQIEPPPPRPVDPTAATAALRRVRILLRPAVGYQFEDGVTVIRGRLRESGAPASPPVAGARAQLAWRDEQGTWWPPPPAPENVDEGVSDAPSPREQQTNEHGEFVVFLRLTQRANVEPDIAAPGLLAVRLQFTRGRSSPVTRATDDDFPFLLDSEDPLGARRGRVPEGRVLARDVTLGWSALTPI